MGNIESQKNPKPAQANTRKQVADKSNTTTKANTYENLDGRPQTEILTTQEVPKEDTELKMTGHSFWNVPKNLILRTTDKELQTGKTSPTHSQMSATSNIMPYSNPQTKHIQPETSSKVMADKNCKGNTNEIPPIMEAPVSVFCAPTILAELRTSNRKTDTEKIANTTVLNYANGSLLSQRPTEGKYVEPSNVQNEEVCKLLPSHKVSPTVNTAVGSGWLPENQKLNAKKVVANAPTENVLNAAIGSGWLSEIQKQDTKEEVANMNDEKLPQKPLPSQAANPTVSTAIVPGWLPGDRKQNAKEVVPNIHAANLPQKPLPCQEVKPIVNTAFDSKWLLGGHKQDKKEVVANRHTANVPQKPTPYQEVKPIVNTVIGSEWLLGGHKQYKKEVASNRHTGIIPQKPTPYQEVKPIVNTVIGSKWLLGGHKQDKIEVASNRHSANLHQKPTPCQEVKPTVSTAIGSEWFPGGHKQDKKEVVANRHTANVPQKPTPRQEKKPTVNTAIGSEWLPENQKHNAKQVLAKMHTASLAPMPILVFLESSKTSMNDKGHHFIALKSPPVKLKDIKAEPTYARPMGTSITQKVELETKKNLQGAHSTYKPQSSCKAQSNIPIQKQVLVTAHLSYADALKKNLQHKPSEQNLDVQPVTKQDNDLKDKYRGKGMPPKQIVKPSQKTANVKKVKVRTTEKRTCGTTQATSFQKSGKELQENLPKTCRRVWGKNKGSTNKTSPNFSCASKKDNTAPQKNANGLPQFNGFCNVNERSPHFVLISADNVNAQPQPNPKASPRCSILSNPQNASATKPSSGIAEMQQSLPNSSKVPYPTQNEDKTDSPLTQEFIEETIQTHSNTQSQLEASKILGYHGMQLPGSSSKNGEFYMEVTGPDVQDGSPKSEKDNRDRAADDRPTRKYQDFFVDRDCSMICRCKHRPRRLPPNVIRWLSVTDNKLSEPAWITTLKVASSLVAGTRFMLDNCSALGPDNYN